jgi:hypothetical protein
MPPCVLRAEMDTEPLPSLLWLVFAKNFMNISFRSSSAIVFAAVDVNIADTSVVYHDFATVT